MKMTNYEKGRRDAIEDVMKIIDTKQPMIKLDPMKPDMVAYGMAVAYNEIRREIMAFRKGESWV